MYIQNNDRHKCSEDTVVSSPSLSAHSPVTFELLSKAEVEFTTTQNVSGQANANSYNFLKGCKWSPDGTCLLTNSDDSTLRLFDTNERMLNIGKTIVPELVRQSFFLLTHSFSL